MKVKKIVALMAAVLCMCFVLAGCGGGGTPQEQLVSYIEKNGAESGDTIAYVYEAGNEFVKKNSPMGDMGNDSDKMETTEECIISLEDGICYIEVIDKEMSFNGITMDRGVKLNIAECTAYYHNSLIFNGADMGGDMNIQIPMSIYTAEDIPTINSSDFAAGSNVTDAMKEAMQEYVNLTLDCFATFAEQELGLSIADFGYEVYVPAK